MTKLECLTTLRRNWIDPKTELRTPNWLLTELDEIDETKIGSRIRVSSRLSRSTTH